jgi:hypothetical protein
MQALSGFQRFFGLQIRAGWTIPLRYKKRKLTFMEIELKNLLVPSGDWFEICQTQFGHGIKWYIRRVVLWAHTSGFARNRVVAVTGECGQFADPTDDSSNYFYVFGLDTCPDGRTWNEVFSVAPFDYDFVEKNITEFASEWRKKLV